MQRYHGAFTGEKSVALTMFVSPIADNFLLSLSRTLALWCVLQLLGYLSVPIMNTNPDVSVRRTISVEYFFGGGLVGAVCEPFMARAAETSVKTVQTYGICPVFL